ALVNDTTVKEYNDDFKAAYSGEMLIINGRVYPQGSGSPTMGKPFASMVNEYARNLDGLCNVYSCVAPLSSAFIEIEKYSYYNRRNKETLDAIKVALTSPSKFCDVFGEMDKHFGELMFYGTDHHWNARGAYYGYVSFCNSAGISPLPLSSMQYKRRKPFLGSLYDLTQDPEVALHPDTAEFYIPPTETKAFRYSANSLTNPVSTKVFCESSNYNAFLCGDAPMIRITTNVRNGRKAAVIKNSMGNAFSVYLISHYEEIWVIDFRYSGHNLMELIATHNINDLIFAVGMYAAMSHGTINMMRNLAKDHSPALIAKRDSVKVHTDTANASKKIIFTPSDTLN
ncbi:MAG: DHHW family protein, partial [Flavobacteriales bacterium]